MPETSFSLASDELGHIVTARPMTSDLRLSIASLVLFSTGHKISPFPRRANFFYSVFLYRVAEIFTPCSAGVLGEGSCSRS